MMVLEVVTSNLVRNDAVRPATLHYTSCSFSGQTEWCGMLPSLAPPPVFKIRCAPALSLKGDRIVYTATGRYLVLPDCQHWDLLQQRQKKGTPPKKKKQQRKTNKQTKQNRTPLIKFEGNELWTISNTF